MSDLPLTTLQDLATMGFTADMIAQQLQAQGWTWDGSVGGLYLPTTDDDPSVVPARNYLASDWTQTAVSPPTPGPSHDYSQEFDNFDRTDDITVQFTADVSVTTATDYTLTESFDVSVNLNIPLGESGTLVGFTATMSSSDVSSKSVSTTVSHSVSFPVTIPGEEGRIVDEKTTPSTTTTTYEASIGAQNCVGIWIDTPWYESNEYIWFLNIERVFPWLTSKSRINLGAVSTILDTTITKVTKPTDGHKLLEPMTLSSDVFRSHPPQADAAFLRTVKMVLGKPKQTDPRDYNGTLNILINFGTATPNPVPVVDRAICASQFKMKIVQLVHNGIMAPSAIFYIPPENPATARFFIRFDPAVITQQALKTDVLTAASETNWYGGNKSITFF